MATTQSSVDLIFQSYAVIVSSVRDTNEARVYRLKAPVPTDDSSTEERVKSTKYEQVGPTLTHTGNFDIFTPGLDIQKIKSVLDNLLSQAHSYIQVDQSSQITGSIPRGSSTVTAHDTFPVFYVREGTPDVVTKDIATAVHTSYSINCYPFRLSQSPTPDRDGMPTWNFLEKATNDMVAKFTPDTEVSKDRDTVYSWIRNRCWDLEMQKTPYRATTK